MRLLVDKGFLYDRGKDLSIKYMKDMQFVAAMVPARCPYGVDPRFVRLFNVFSISFPPEDSIRRIYTTILETFFTSNAFDKSILEGFVTEEGVGVKGALAKQDELTIFQPS